MNDQIRRFVKDNKCCVFMDERKIDRLCFQSVGNGRWDEYADLIPFPQPVARLWQTAADLYKFFSYEFLNPGSAKVTDLRSEKNVEAQVSLLVSYGKRVCPLCFLLHLAPPIRYEVSSSQQALH